MVEIPYYIKARNKIKDLKYIPYLKYWLVITMYLIFSFFKNKTLNGTEERDKIDATNA